VDLLASEEEVARRRRGGAALACVRGGEEEVDLLASKEERRRCTCFRHLVLAPKTCFHELLLPRKHVYSHKLLLHKLCLVDGYGAWRLDVDLLDAHLDADACMMLLPWACAWAWA
jgi:hypothetical protein